MKKLLLSSAAAVISWAYMPAVASAQQAEVDSINLRYDAAFAALEAEINEWQSEAPAPSDVEATINAEFGVTWEVTDFSFDVPEIRFETREFSFDVPQFTWETTGFSMDIPETYMAPTKVGEYPCFDDWKWYSCDIVTDVPQFRMVRHDFSFDLPQVFWDRTSFSMDIPEFYTTRVEIKMHLPQFELESVSGEISDYQAEGEAFAARAQELGSSQESEIKVAVAAELELQKANIVVEFDEAIASLDGSISDISAAGLDPANVQSSDGLINLFAMRDDVIAKRDAALAGIDAMLGEMSA